MTEQWRIDKDRSALAEYDAREERKARQMQSEKLFDTAWRQAITGYRRLNRRARWY